MDDQNNFTFNEISLIYMKMFRVVGLVPFENRTPRYYKTILLTCFSYYVVISMNISWLACIVKEHRITMRLTFDELSLISEEIIIFSVLVRYAIAHTKRKKLLNLIKRCKELWTYLNPDEIYFIKNFEKKAQYVRKFLLFQTYFCYCCFIMCSQIQAVTAENQNGTKRRNLPFKFYIDIQENPEFTTLFLIQLITVGFYMYLFVSIESIGSFLIMMACGYFRVLKERILIITELKKDTALKINNEDNNELNLLSINDIRNCIIFHQKILLYCVLIDNYIGPIYFWLVTASLYNISIIGITLLEQSTQWLVHLTVFLAVILTLLVCQCCPEYLLIESESIGDTAYIAIFGKFYHLRHVRYSLYFMMVRAKKPMQILAGGFVRLSIETFGKMVKSAFSAFMVFTKFQH